VYGQKFYDYHCQFSVRAAAILRDKNIKVDWAIQDNNLLSMVIGNAKVNTCQFCQQSDHSTAFCHMHLWKSREQYTHSRTCSSGNVTVDKYGRPKLTINGKEVCNNFNTGKCARGPSCPYSHICSACQGQGHGASMCKDRTSKGNNP